MNAFLQGFDPQGNFGQQSRQRSNNKKVNGFLSVGNTDGAILAAGEGGNVSQMTKLREYAAKMSDHERKQATEDYSLFGGIAMSAKNIPLEGRNTFIQQQLTRAGRDPKLVEQLHGVDDASLTAFGQSVLSVSDQLKQFTTEFKQVGDTTTLQRTNNFNGIGTVTNAFNAPPSYKDVTARTKAEAGPKPSAMMQQYGQARREGYKGGFMAYQKELKAAGRSSVTVNTGDGEGQFNSPFSGNKALTKAFAAKDAGLYADALDKANLGSDMLLQFDEIEKILNEGYGTGATSGYYGKASALAAGLNLASEDTAKRAAQYERMDSITNELGARALSLFGGSDTEKELEVAIKTQPRPEYRKETNYAIIARKKLAIEALAGRADFMADWLGAYGSTVAKNFSAAWRKHQKHVIGSAPKIEEKLSGKSESAKGSAPKGSLQVQPNGRKRFTP